MTLTWLSCSKSSSKSTTSELQKLAFIVCFEFVYIVARGIIMDEFETINLDTKECKICKQQTGEELITCILHEKFSSSGSQSSLYSNGVEAFAHRICLERWDAVMKSSFYPQQKKSWRDRIMGLINVGQASNQESIETWTPVDHSDHADDKDYSPSSSFTGEQTDRQLPGINAQQSMFSDSKEAYRVEVVGNEHGQWRKNKVRIRSVDLEDSEADENEPAAAVSISRERNFIRHTRSTLLHCDLIQLKEAIEDLKLKINKVSSDLVTQLQEKDSLLLQKHTMKVTVGQLINLQSNVKTASTQIVSRPTNSRRTLEDTLPFT